MRQSAITKTIQCALAALFLAAAPLARAEDPAPSDPKFFEAKVYPIFQSRCVSCHGPEKQKGKLRLDTADAIKAGGEGGPIFVAGKSAESSLFVLVSKPKDDPDIMPANGDPLTPEQIETIKQWIDAGANLGDFKGGAPASQNDNVAAADSAVKMAAPGEVKPYDGGILATLAKDLQPAAPEAVKALTDAGALALNIDRSSPLLSVNFKLAGAQVTDDKLAALAQAAPQVTWLDLGNTKITDGGLAVLAQLPNVTVLHLERTGITDAGLDHVKGLQHLEYLNVYGTEVTDAGLAKLEGLKSLKKLYVWQSKATPEGVEKIKAAIPGIYVNNGIEMAKATEAVPADAPKAEMKFDDDSCCAKAKAEGKECDHPCCVEARKAGKVCEKCNPKSAAAAPADAPKAELKFDDESCCAKAKAEGKECDHPCCVEARNAGKVCEKCNPKSAAASAAAPAGDISLLFDKDSCCATAKAGGKDCDHPCCVEARNAGKVCEKCNPNGAAQKNVAKKFDKDSCCDKAQLAARACDHPCCVEAAKNGQICKQCNPQAA